MTALDMAILGIRRNNPAMFSELRKKMCKHEDNLQDDDGNIIRCLDCGYEPITIVDEEDKARDEELLREE